MGQKPREQNATNVANVTKIDDISKGRDNSPRSGRGGRRFKSCHSDQILSVCADFPQLSATIVVSERAPSTQGVHRRELRMVRLLQDSNGNFERVSGCPMTCGRNMAGSTARATRPNSSPRRPLRAMRRSGSSVNGSPKSRAVLRPSVPSETGLGALLRGQGEQARGRMVRVVHCPSWRREPRGHRLAPRGSPRSTEGRCRGRGI